MSFEKEYRNIAEWIKSGNSISFDPQYDGRIFVVACDESNMVVAFVYDGRSIDTSLSKLDTGIYRYIEFQETIDEINT